jgi:hypothetical protein
MKTDTLNMFARTRALALAAMIDAGGKPCWVATYAPDGSPAAGACAPSASPALRAGPPARSPAAGACAPSASPALRAGSLSLTALERVKYPAIDDALAAALDRTFSHLADDAPAPAASP